MTPHFLDDEYQFSHITNMTPGLLKLEVRNNQTYFSAGLQPMHGWGLHEIPTVTYVLYVDVMKHMRDGI
jgi:hypothetical protein